MYLLGSLTPGVVFSVCVQIFCAVSRSFTVLPVMSSLP